MNPADITHWAWVMVILAGLNLVVQAAAAGLLLRTHLRRHRPLLNLAEVMVSGDLEKARYLLGQVPGTAGDQLRAICGPTVESGPAATARERFLTAYLVAYPGAPAGPKVWTTVLCGSAALLPFLAGAAGRASVVSAAMAVGAAVPDAALDLYRLGLLETMAAGVVAWAIMLGVHHLDPGARSVRRRLVGQLRTVRSQRSSSRKVSASTAARPRPSSTMPPT